MRFSFAAETNKKRKLTIVDFTLVDYSWRADGLLCGLDPQQNRIHLRQTDFSHNV